MHFYCDGNIDRLSQFVGSEKSCENAISLVKVPDFNRSKLKDIFKRTQLQLDSEVYAIVKEGTGQLKSHEIMFQITEFNKRISISTIFFTSGYA